MVDAVCVQNLDAEEITNNNSRDYVIQQEAKLSQG